MGKQFLERGRIALDLFDSLGAKLLWLGILISFVALILAQFSIGSWSLLFIVPIAIGILYAFYIAGKQLQIADDIWDMLGQAIFSLPKYKYGNIEARYEVDSDLRSRYYMSAEYKVEKNKISAIHNEHNFAKESNLKRIKGYIAVKKDHILQSDIRSKDDSATEKKWAAKLDTPICSGQNALVEHIISCPGKRPPLSRSPFSNLIDIQLDNDCESLAMVFVLPEYVDIDDVHYSASHEVGNVRKESSGETICVIWHIGKPEVETHYIFEIGLPSSIREYRKSMERPKR